MLGVTRIFDGDKLYSISPDDEEVTISSQDPEDETTITPNKMLYFYEDGYYFEMDESRLIGNGQFRKKVQYVKLVPKDSEAEIKYILLGIDTEFNQIYEVIETGKNETVTTISIVDFEFNLPLDANLFVFDLIILDIMMPKVSGMKFLEKLFRLTLKLELWVREITSILCKKRYLNSRL